MDDNQPKGIGFFNIRSGETHYARLEPQIQAYINSSDMGINASRDQDFGWRLEPEWVKKVKAFRRNETKMQFLTDRNGGQKVTTTQILYAIYGEQLRAAQEVAEENENPFEEEYLQNIASKPQQATQPEAIMESVDEDDLDNFDAINGANDVNTGTPTDNAPSAPELNQEVDAADLGNKSVSGTETPGAGTARDSSGSPAKPTKKK